MQVAILSDIHDNIWKLEAALKRVHGAEALVCCGDLCSPFIVDQLGRGFDGPIHIVFGNNDADRYRMMLKAKAYPHLTFHGEFVELELGGLRFAVQHFDDVGHLLASNPCFDVVCFGHNHEYRVDDSQAALSINPGEIMGGLSAEQVSTLVLLETANRTVEKVVL